VLSDLAFDFDINTFFWFFTARNDPENAPLLVYFAGGPGESSTYTVLDGEGGPCVVNNDGNSTRLSPWSFNNYANALWIDQPVGAGFSHTSLRNATYNVATQEIETIPEGEEVPEDNVVVGAGTYPDPTLYATTNTSVSTSKAFWHFAEHWLSRLAQLWSSPGYSLTSRQLPRVSIPEQEDRHLGQLCK
jgi:hypothetical protein